MRALPPAPDSPAMSSPIRRAILNDVGETSMRFEFGNLVKRGDDRANSFADTLSSGERTKRNGEENSGEESRTC